MMKRAWFVMCGLTMATACGERRNWEVCDKDNPCQKGFACIMTESARTGTCKAGVDAGMDVKDAPVEFDLRPDLVIFPDAAMADIPVDIRPADSVTRDGILDLAPDFAPDLPSPDLAIPDAAGTCSIDEHCRTDAGPGYCVNNRCVACKENTHCGGSTPYCSKNVCMACTALPSACSGATQACDSSTGKCVECLSTNDCVAGADAAISRVCDTTAKVCVECNTHGDCKEGNKPLCNAQHTCVACDNASAPANGCKDKGGGKPACRPAAGTCVECAANTDCTSVVGKPVCDTSTNLCVTCMADTDCTSATLPICNTTLHTCQACAADSECASKLGQNPGVCMSHQDGRCATDGETIYVDNATGCSTSSVGGTASNPYCGLQSATNALSASKRLILVRGTNVAGFALNATSNAQVSLIGKGGATVRAGTIDINNTGSPCMSLAGSTNLYVRELSAVGSTLNGTPVKNIGISANAGTTLQLEKVKVTDNAGGGIMLSGAAFDFDDVLVSGNGPGTDGAISWGGIFIKSSPATGPKILDHVSIVENEQVGMTCTASLTAVTSLYASGNAGGVEVSPTCAITSCSPATPGTCGSSLTP